MSEFFQDVGFPDLACPIEHQRLFIPGFFPLQQAGINASFHRRFGFQCANLHFYGEINKLLLRFYGGISVVCQHFYVGINVAALHFYGDNCGIGCV